MLQRILICGPLQSRQSSRNASFLVRSVRLQQYKIRNAPRSHSFSCPLSVSLSPSFSRTLSSTASSDSVTSSSPSGSSAYNTPQSNDCQNMPRKYRSASNDVLSILAAQNVFGARKERLLREIMAKDQCTWPEARERLYAINLYNDENGWLFQLPYKLGIFLGVVGGFGCIPLVFHKQTALMFNERFVHEELPDDLSNVWQVGEWTWGWMEPALGTLSFTLLALQLSRQFLKKLDLQPYTDKVNDYRANRLAAKFPEYEREIVRDFAKSDSWVDTAKASHRKLVDKEIEAGKAEDQSRLQ